MGTVDANQIKQSLATISIRELRTDESVMIEQAADLRFKVAVKVFFRDVRRRWIGRGFDAHQIETAFAGLQYHPATVATQWRFVVCVVFIHGIIE